MRCIESYIDDVAEAQGHLFCIIAEKAHDLLDFMPKYAKTKMRVGIDNGIPWYCTRFGTEIYEWLLENNFKFKPCKLEQSQYVAEWTGVFYAYAQWHADTSFEELVRRLTPRSVISRYGVLHDLDVNLAVEKVLASELFIKG